MRANRIYQITKSKQIDSIFKKFKINKVKVFKVDGSTKIYLIENKDNYICINGCQDIEKVKTKWYKKNKRNYNICKRRIK